MGEINNDNVSNEPMESAEEPKEGVADEAADEASEPAAE
jgi:hypothetical protein